MAQSLEQKKTGKDSLNTKVDSISDFMPHWTMIMEKFYMENKKSINDYHELDSYGGNWFHGNSCFVGEANGFTHWDLTNNTCRECYLLSRSMLPKEGLASFYQFKEELYNHMQVEHWK